MEQHKCNFSNKKLAIVFPGQGAQCKGMGLDVLNDNPLFHQMIEIAEAKTGLPLEEVITQGDERLHQTRFTQPSLLLAIILLYEDLLKNYALPTAVFAGFSLGEYAALYASGVVDIAVAFSLINERACATQRASEQEPGSMAAVLALDNYKVEEICHRVTSYNNIVTIANYNCPGQTVISGHKDAVAEAGKLCLESGARRVMPLQVSGAFHSPLMHRARLEFEPLLNAFNFYEPHTPIIMNATAKPLQFDQLKRNMAEQLEAPVRWEQTINLFKETGIQCVLEIGPGTVLAGLVRKTAPDIDVFSYNKTADFELLKGWLKNHELI
ncbi:MAG TPA: [acyl-carrier-protein] S-malonyltransferase [Firmicutes bacterium]|nr:[acyl-carrier-protein] S-malonyltransferase [Bacillota bacterium]